MFSCFEQCSYLFCNLIGLLYVQLFYFLMLICSCPVIERWALWSLATTVELFIFPFNSLTFSFQLCAPSFSVWMFKALSPCYGEYFIKLYNALLPLVTILKQNSSIMISVQPSMLSSGFYWHALSFSIFSIFILFVTLNIEWDFF